MKLVTYTPKQRRRPMQLVSASVSAVRVGQEHGAIVYVSRDSMTDADRDGHFAFTLTLSVDEARVLIERLARALEPVNALPVKP